MELTSVMFYQAVKLPKHRGKAVNAQSIIPEANSEHHIGCKLVFEKGIVTVSNPEWPEDVHVGLANIRSFNTAKEQPNGKEESDKKENSGGSGSAGSKAKAKPGSPKTK